MDIAELCEFRRLRAFVKTKLERVHKLVSLMQLGWRFYCLIPLYSYYIVDVANSYAVRCLSTSVSNPRISFMKLSG